MQTEEPDALIAERKFFNALIESQVVRLDELLTDDFLLIDALSGAEITKPALLGVLSSGQLKFEKIDVLDSRVRSYDVTAVVTGRTQMHGRFGEAAFTISSRYTHVYTKRRDEWRLVTAQGTQITDV